MYVLRRINPSRQLSWLARDRINEKHRMQNHPTKARNFTTVSCDKAPFSDLLQDVAKTVYLPCSCPSPGGFAFPSGQEAPVTSAAMYWIAKILTNDEHTQPVKNNPTE